MVTLLKRITFVFLAAFLLGSFLLTPSAARADVYVNGYFKSNGTYVQPYYRSSPDSNPYNNYSYPGNTNPYTGKTATGNPSTYLNNYYNGSGSSYYSPSYSVPPLPTIAPWVMPTVAPYVFPTYKPIPFPTLAPLPTYTPYNFNWPTLKPLPTLLPLPATVPLYSFLQSTPTPPNTTKTVTNANSQQVSGSNLLIYDGQGKVACNLKNYRELPAALTKDINLVYRCVIGANPSVAVNNYWQTQITSNKSLITRARLANAIWSYYSNPQK